MRVQLAKPILIFVCSTVVSLAGATLCWAAPGNLPPAAAFFETADLFRPSISPDGSKMALLTKAKDGRVALAVCSTGERLNCQVVAHSDEGDVSSADWVNDHRLFFRTTDLTDAGARAHTFAVNSDGTQLFDMSADSGFLAGANRATVGRSGYSYYARLTNESDSIIMTSRERGYSPAVMDTGNGEMHQLLDEPAPKNSSFWVLDLDLSPRIAGVAGPAGYSFFYRQANSHDWQPFATASEFTGRRFEPESFADKDSLYIHAYDGEGFLALFKMDPASPTIPANPVIKLDGFDMNGSLELDRKAKVVLGAHFETDGLGTVWFDKSFRDSQAKIDKALPYTMNRISCGECTTSEKLVVSAFSDREPPAYYLFDPKSGQLTRVGASRPSIKAAQMGHRDFYHFAARDGLSIPIYVTTPPLPKTGPWPTVVLLHDGPWGRGAYGEWSDKAQFLASRGYLVLEPQYRGTNGFGSKLLQAGYRQWGKAIQDDIADSVKWSIGKGWTDPKRVAAGGEGYGGFATMMALARNPELFRCGFQALGLTNVADLFERRWSTAERPYLSFDPVERVGDPDTDAVDLARDSPLGNAAAIHQPLLMAYVGRNSYTNLAEGERMRDALSAAGNHNVEWLYYKDERGTWTVAADAIDYWSHVEKFLETNLASAP